MVFAIKSLATRSFSKMYTDCFLEQVITYKIALKPLFILKFLKNIFFVAAICKINEQN